jgi:E3 ubiquitin-protein ligase HUWE1
LPKVLDEFPTRWPFHRGDLYHWIPLLNRFDSELAQFVKQYGLDQGPQRQQFKCSLLLATGQSEAQLQELGLATDGDREVIESILVFTRILLENCGNRSIYGSSPYLSDILNSTSLSLVVCTLQIGTQLAQRYQASVRRLGPQRQANPTLLANHYNIDLTRVQQLAQPFSKTVTTTETAPSIPNTPVTPKDKGKDKSYFGLPPSAPRTTTITTYANNFVELIKSDGESSKADGKGKSVSYAQDVPADDEWSGWADVRLTYYESGAAKDVEVTSPSRAQAQDQSPSIRRQSTLGHQHRSTARSDRTRTSEDQPPVTPQRSATLPVSFTPHEPAAASSAPKVLEIPGEKVLTADLEALVEEYMPQVPEAERYVLLNKLRTAKAMAASAEQRRQVLAVRLLAITNLAYIYPESTFLNTVVKQDGDVPRRLQIIYQLAEILHSGSAEGEETIPKWLQTIAAGCLESFSIHMSKQSDICTALNTNVNHGVLLYILRKAVVEMETDQASDKLTVNDEWRNALFPLLGVVATLHRAGQELVSAGLLPVLIDILKMRSEVASRTHPKVIGFLDPLIYNIKEAFPAMVTADGLDALSDLIVNEVTVAAELAKQGRGIPDKYKSKQTDYQIPFFRQQTIKWCFKFIHHMMSQNGAYGGNFDRLLRNLIDSQPLLCSLRETISNASVYGSSVWTQAVSILNDFINNEPTSYAVISEAGLSKAVLEAVMGEPMKVVEETKKEDDEKKEDIPAPQESTAGESAEARPGTAGSGDTDHDTESLFSVPPDNTPHPPTQEMLEQPRPEPLAKGILPAAEALMVIPDAFGAICLNNAGMKMFMESNALQNFFEIFESPAHVKVMGGENQLATSLGGTFDELVRHHPPLKVAIQNAVIDMVARVSHLCKSKCMKDNLGVKLWTQNKKGEVVPADIWGQPPLESGMEVDSAPPAGQEVEMTDESEPSSPTSLSAPSEEDANSISSFISVVACFLSSVTSNTGIKKFFMEKGGAEYLLDMAELPIMPTSGHHETASRNLQSLIAQLGESQGHLLIPSLVKRIQGATDNLLSFAQHKKDDLYFGKYIMKGMRESADGRHAVGSIVQSMMTVVNLASNLKGCYAMPMYSRNSGNSFQTLNLTDYFERLVKTLTPVLAACVHETVIFNQQIPNAWKQYQGELHKTFGDFAHPKMPTVDTTTEVLTQTVASHEGPLTMSEAVADAGGVEKSILLARSAHNAVVTAEDKSSVEYKNFSVVSYLCGKLCDVLPKLFNSFGKSLVPKRAPDAYQREGNEAIADALVQAVLDQLKIEGTPSYNEYTYWILMLGHLREILLTSPSSSPVASKEATTIAVRSFIKLKGMERTNGILMHWVNEINERCDQTVAAADAEAVLKNSLANRGVRDMLELYLPLVTGKTVGDASQTHNMRSRYEHNERGKPEYFNESQMVVELRMAVIGPVTTMWENSSLTEKASKVIPRSLIDIIRVICQADHEDKAFKRSEEAIKILPRQKKQFRLNQDWLKKGVDQGFDSDLVSEALYRCNNIAPAYLEYCKIMSAERSGGRNRPPNGEIASLAPRPGGTPGTGTPQEGQAMQIDSGNAAATTDNAVPPPARNPLDPESIQDLLDQARALNRDEFADFLATHGHEMSAALEPQALPERTATDSSIAGKTIADQPEFVTVDDLNEAREKIRVELIDRCLDIVNAHGEFTFEIADLIRTVIDKAPDSAAMRSTTAETMIMALASFVFSDGDEPIRSYGKKVAAYAHLLALLLQQKPFYEAALNEGLKANLETLLLYVNLPPDHKSEETSPWISHILIIFEIMLADSEEPSETDWKVPTPETFQSAPQPVLKPPKETVGPEHRQKLFETLLDILPRIGKDETLAVQVLRILVILTRDRALATSMGEKKGIQRLFVMAKQLVANRGNQNRIHGPLMMILRHIVEDDETIKQIMRSEIKNWFDAIPSRQRGHPDLTSMLRQLHHLVIRQPVLFTEVTNEMIQIVKGSNIRIAHDHPSRVPVELQEKWRKSPRKINDVAVLPPVPTTGDITLDDVKPSTEAVDADAAAESKPAEHKPPVVENPDGVIHFLLCELLNYRDVEDKEPVVVPAAEEKKEGLSTDEALNKPFPPGTPGTPSTSTPATTQPADATSTSPAKTDPKKKKEFKPEEHPIYLYRCFLLNCLTELLWCYNRTKVEFINFKRNAPTHAATPNKPRSSVVNYLLFDLLPTGTLEHADNPTQRKKLNTSIWADAVLTALLAKTGEAILERDKDPLFDEDEPDLQFVRKFVLERVLQAYREASASTEALDVKYSRMMVLADLMTNVMKGKDNTFGGSDASVTVRSQRQLKRMMFEKGFIGALTASIADIDLNFPNAKRAVKHILRPLKALTQTAIELSEAGKVERAPGEQTEEEIETASSVSDLEDEREETPDLFRNSTLGMFEPDRDAESTDEEGDEDEEMYDEDGYDDEEMDYDDGPIDPDDEDNISEEDEELEGMGPIEGLDGDIGVDVEIEEDDDDEDDSDEDDDEDDDDEDEDMDDEEEEDDRVEIVDEHGNPIEDEHDDEWESALEDEDEEDDGYGHEEDEDEEEMANGVDAMGRLVAAYGAEGGHDAAITNILNTIQGDMDVDHGWGDDGHDHDHDEDDEDDEGDDLDDDDDEGELIDDDEDMYPDEYEGEFPYFPTLLCPTALRLICSCTRRRTRRHALRDELGWR